MYQFDEFCYYCDFLSSSSLQHKRHQGFSIIERFVSTRGTAIIISDTEEGLFVCNKYGLNLMPVKLLQLTYIS